MGTPAKDPVEIPVKLWIDTKTGIPAKLEIRWTAVLMGHGDFTETLRLTINETLDNKLFELPK